MNEYPVNSSSDEAEMNKPFPVVSSVDERLSLQDSNVNADMLRLVLRVVNPSISIYIPPPYPPAVQEWNCNELNVS